MLIIPIAIKWFRSGCSWPRGRLRQSFCRHIISADWPTHACVFVIYMFVVVIDCLPCLFDLHMHASVLHIPWQRQVWLVDSLMTMWIVAERLVKPQQATIGVSTSWSIAVNHKSCIRYPSDACPTHVTQLTRQFRSLTWADAYFWGTGSPRTRVGSQSSRTRDSLQRECSLRESAVQPRESCGLLPPALSRVPAFHVVRIHTVHPAAVRCDMVLHRVFFARDNFNQTCNTSPPQGVRIPGFEKS